MQESKPQKEEIYTMGQHSDLSPQSFQTALEEWVYPGRSSWKKFLKILFLVLGISFFTSGIVFFFAYNWDSLDKSVKLIIAEFLVVGSIVSVLIIQANHMVRHILLTSSAVLVGVLFAVFGQIYQTGANAYDFFLAWTIFISVWVFVSKFPPLWLFYLVLINTTLILFHRQTTDWSAYWFYGLLFLVNSLAFIISNLSNAPLYFKHIVGITATVFATLAAITGIFEYQKEYPTLLLVYGVIGILYTLGLWHGFKHKNSFYLSTIPFSLIIIVSAALIHYTDGAEEIFLVVSLFIIVSVIIVINNLVHMQKEKKHGKKY